MKSNKREVKAIEKVGDTLRKIRTDKGISMHQLAILADMEYSQISRIERGKINTSVSQLVTISKVLKIHPKELFDFEL